MIIFNEFEYAEYLLKHGFDKFMSARELIILARYFKYIGKNDEQIKEDIHNFCYKYNIVYDKEFYSKTTNFVFENYPKHKLIIPNPVPIKQKEIDAIKTLGDYKGEKVLFFLLVYAKHFKLNVGIKDYYANIKWTEIFTSTKVHIKLQEQYDLVSKMYSNNLIDIILSGTKKVTPFHINFVDDESEPIFYVNDFKNIIKFYPHYCSVCGKQIDKKVYNHKFCEECWKERKNDKNKEWMKKYRNNN